jgi:hypothetical protein
MLVPGTPESDTVRVGGGVIAGSHMLPGREKSGIPNGSFRGRYGLLLPK